MQAVYPTKRELLPEMLTKITDEITKYVNDDKLVNRLKVCSEEILVNIVDYSQSDKLYISCEFLDSDNSLRFEFTDEGKQFNPLEEKPEVDIDAGIDERGIGGLGIFLYTTIMDKMEYCYKDGKNHLIAIKKLSDKEMKTIAL